MIINNTLLPLYSSIVGGFSWRFDVRSQEVHGAAHCKHQTPSQPAREVIVIGQSLLLITVEFSVQKLPFLKNLGQ